MTCETKISKDFQTVVPSDIRKKFDLSPGDILVWKTTNNGANIIFRKKVNIEDIFGIVEDQKLTQ